MILVTKVKLTRTKSTMSFGIRTSVSTIPKHFPVVCVRSGEFTVAEADSLENTAPVMLALYQGNLALAMT